MCTNPRLAAAALRTLRGTIMVAMSETAKPRRNRRLVYLLLVAGAAIAVVVVVRSSSVQIRYHEWQMQRAWNETYGKPPDVQHDELAGYTLGESHERYQYHRQRLVALGAVRELHYRFGHILSGTEASRQLSELLVSHQCPTHIDFKSPYTDKPEPMELTVWCFLRNADAWETFMAEHDRADVATQ